MKIFFIIATVGQLFAAMLAAAEIPTIQVQFQIADQRFRDELGTSRAAAEEIFLPILLQELEKHIGFLRFSPEAAPARESRYRLVIRLGDKDLSTGEIRFH